MYYEASDLLETADNETLELIARVRELTREYYFSDYEDTEKRAAIRHELLGRMGKMQQLTHLFIAIMGKYFSGKQCDNQYKLHYRR